MPSSSKSQQRAAGMALAAKKGEMEVSELKGAAKDMYDSMSKKELEDFATTKHDGLPQKVGENKINRFKDFISENVYLDDEENDFKDGFDMYIKNQKAVELFEYEDNVRLIDDIYYLNSTGIKFENNFKYVNDNKIAIILNEDDVVLSFVKY